MLGGPELKDYSRFIGWDATTYVVADLVDAMNLNTKILIDINSEKASPDVVLYQRPGEMPSTTVQPTETLDDFGNRLRMMFGPGNIGG